MRPRRVHMPHMPILFLVLTGTNFVHGRAKAPEQRAQRFSGYQAVDDALYTPQTYKQAMHSNRYEPQGYRQNDELFEYVLDPWQQKKQRQQNSDLYVGDEQLKKELKEFDDLAGSVDGRRPQQHHPDRHHHSKFRHKQPTDPLGDTLEAEEEAKARSAASPAPPSTPLGPLPDDVYPGETGYETANNVDNADRYAFADPNEEVSVTADIYDLADKAAKYEASGYYRIRHPLNSAGRAVVGTVKRSIEGIYFVARHPLKALNLTARALRHPIKTVKLMGTEFKDNMRKKGFTYAMTSVATTLALMAMPVKSPFTNAVAGTVSNTAHASKIVAATEALASAAGTADNIASVGDAQRIKEEEEEKEEEEKNRQRDVLEMKKRRDEAPKIDPYTATAGGQSLPSDPKLFGEVRLGAKDTIRET